MGVSPGRLRRRARALAGVALAMCAFAANSLLCRGALAGTAIDPASFTAVRLAAGALFLRALMRRRARAASGARPSWWGALALWAYAAAFSEAYLGLTAATGALLLFGAVQLTMLGAGFARGERFGAARAAGAGAALLGLVHLLLPGAARPPAPSAALMLVSGIAWGAYSLLGRRVSDPLGTTAGNFTRAALLGALALVLLPREVTVDRTGLVLAVASGALASGGGYAVWYAVLPRLGALEAGTVQLSVPVLAALGAVAFLHEPVGARLPVAAALVLGGVALALWAPAKRR